MAKPKAELRYGLSVICTGTGSFRSPHSRSLPSTVVSFGGLQVLVDCGDGTARQMTRFDLGTRLDAILLTEPSGEKVAGLLTLAGYLQRVKQRKQLAVYGPPGTERAVEALVSLSPDLEQFFTVQEVGDGDCFFSAHGKHIEAAELEASSDARSYAYRFFEDPLPGRVDAQKAAARGIQGADFARLQAGEKVRGVRPEDVVGPMRPGRSAAVCGRSRPCPALTTVLENVDVGVIPAPFMDERLESAQRTFTLTGWEAASAASKAEVKLLLLVQLSGASAPMAQLGEARRFHRNVFLPWDGDGAGVPMPDKGDPRVERWRDRRPAR